MYFLLILQATFLGESAYDALIVGLASSACYGGLLAMELHDILPPVAMPFENLALQQNFGYCMLKWMWLTSMFILCAGLGTYMIREVLRQKERLRQVIIKDSLTGVYNRAYFDSQFPLELERATRRRSSLTLVLADLDQFKRVNDRYGHQTGDRALRRVARRLQAELRRIDQVCRIGGEEFALILPDTPQVAAREVMARLLEQEIAVDVSAAGKTQRVAVTLSYGVVTFPEAGTDAFELYRKADELLYASKHAGRNRCHFWDPGGSHSVLIGHHSHS
jgi:diguanylate cyclase (GGDEF)-like protein